MKYCNQLSSINQYISNRIRRQHQDATMPALQHFVIDAPQSFFSQFTPAQLAILNRFFYLDGRHKEIYVPQGKVGVFAGLSREYVNRCLLIFEQAGIIKIINRGVKKTCIYKISDYFRDPVNRTKLVSFFACFAFMPFNAYVCRGGVWQKRDQIEKVTQLYNKSSFNSNLSSFIKNSLSFSPTNLFSEQSPQQADIQNSITYVECCRKREIMNEQVIRPSILALKALNLTLSGQVTLMQFPDEAITYAAAALKKAYGVKDPLRFFLKQCHDYCKDNNLRRDYNIYNTLLQEYKLPDNAKLSNSTLPAYRAQPVTKRHDLEEAPKRLETGEQYSSRMKEAWRAHEISNKRDPQRKESWNKTPEEQAHHLETIPRFLLDPLLKLAFASTKVDQGKKMSLVRTMSSMNISFDGILSDKQISDILWVGSPVAPADDILRFPEDITQEV